MRCHNFLLPKCTSILISCSAKVLFFAFQCTTFVFISFGGLSACLMGGLSTNQLHSIYLLCDRVKISV